MADPLTKQRVEAFSSAMDLLSLPVSELRMARLVARLLLECAAVMP